MKASLVLLGFAQAVSLESSALSEANMLAMAESLSKAKLHAKSKMKAHSKAKTQAKDVANLEQFMMFDKEQAKESNDEPLMLA